MICTRQAQPAPPRTPDEKKSKHVYISRQLCVSDETDRHGVHTHHAWPCLDETKYEHVHERIQSGGTGLEGGRGANPLVFLVPSPSTAKKTLGVHKCVLL